MNKETELGGHVGINPDDFKVKYDSDGNEIIPSDDDDGSQKSENSKNDDDEALNVTLSDDDSSSSDSDQKLDGQLDQDGNVKTIVEYPLSERTELKDKLLFIHLNKNKFYIAKMLESSLFNIIRMCIMWMTFNVIFSSSILNIFLVAGCYYLAKKKSDIFLNMSTRYYVIFCGYFIVNWVLFRNKFIEK